MNYCKDCKYFEGKNCMKSGDPVTGEPLSAREARDEISQCGISARWFEPVKEDWKDPRDEQGFRK